MTTISCQRKPSLMWLMAESCMLMAITGCAGSDQSLMAVNVPLLDLRAQPHTTAAVGTHDPLEETQLLYGERVQIVKVEEGWAYVEAVEQPEFTHARRWQGYPGWVPAETLVPWEPLRSPTIVVTDLWAPTFTNAYTRIPAPWRFPLGTRLRAVEIGGTLWKVELVDGTTVWMPREFARSIEELAALPPLEQRRTIVRHAERFLGAPYFWGGRSPVRDGPGSQVTGVDCSGLVNLAFRAAGIDIPRDAHEQFLRARRINALQPADLIFLSERSNPDHIVHVMLYAGDGEVIEGPGTGQPVRRIAITKRLGQSLDWLTSGAVVDGQTVSFGTYLP